jgi:single-strand DNA-binding protein
MKDVNKVILVGRLGADPIRRHTKSGFPVAHFAVATSRRIYKDNPSASPADNSESATTPLTSVSSDSSTTHVEETQWHQIVAWGKQGEACAQYLKKGHSVYVEGMIKSRNWEGKDGAQRTSFEIHSENISFLGWPKGEATSQMERAV